MDTNYDEDEGSSVDQATRADAQHKADGELDSLVPKLAVVVVEADGSPTPQPVELTGDAVYLNYKQLETIPNGIFSPDIVAALRRLYMKHNLLNILSPEIRQLQSLTELYLHSNQLVSIPNEVCELKCLEFLAVGDNILTSLPKAIGKLQSLKRLQISQNKLTQLPKEIGHLQQLQVLDVSHNLLRWLPAELSHCTSLRRLSIDCNYLATLPRELCHLQNLTEISACENQLVCLPQDLGCIPTLEAVYVDKNPYLKAVPASTLRKTIGFFSSGKSPIPDNLLRKQRVLTFKAGSEEEITIPMPVELRSVGHICRDCVPLLQELAMRVVYKTRQKSALPLEEEEIPSDLISHLNSRTAQCQHCVEDIFISAFPVIFRAQVQVCDLLLLGLCCSASCVRQCSLIVNLPLIYPRLEDLALALVLA